MGGTAGSGSVMLLLLLLLLLLLRLLLSQVVGARCCIVTVPRCWVTAGPLVIPLRAFQHLLARDHI